MRKIDWEKPLSEQDIAWLRQTGIPGIEERIERHQNETGGEVPEVNQTEDTGTRSAFDPTSTRTQVVSDGASAPINVTPSPEDVRTDTEDEGDDYESWKVAELKEEVAARNKLSDEREDVTPISIEGTGKEGAITKQDVIKALRVWDDENPGVLDEPTKD